MESALNDLEMRLAEISDLSKAAGVLGWDQRVSMPPLGTEARANQLATLGRITHERFIDPEVGRLLGRLAPYEESHAFDSYEASLVRVTRRDWEKQRRVPVELEEEMTRAAASGHHAWVEARRNHDFASFLPYLERNVELKRRYVECFEWSDSPYIRLSTTTSLGCSQRRYATCSRSFVQRSPRSWPRLRPSMLRFFVGVPRRSPARFRRSRRRDARADRGLVAPR